MRPVVLAVLGFLFWPQTLEADGPRLELDSQVVWEEADPRFGGYSGFALAPDGRSFLAHGIPAVTLSSLDAGGFPRGLHSAADSRDRLSPAAIERAVELLEAMVRRAERDPAALRAAFSGELSYAASWDEAHLVPFWPELDLVGIDFYYPVARRPDAGRVEILAGWQPWLARLERLHRQTGRPIVIAEIGYRSVDGAALHPYAFGNDATIDLREQADLYWAAIEATGGESWIAGIYFWNWLASGGGGPEDLLDIPRVSTLVGPYLCWRPSVAVRPLPVRA